MEDYNLLVKLLILILNKLISKYQISNQNLIYTLKLMTQKLNKLIQT